jgi:hypothetical protein
VIPGAGVGASDRPGRVEEDHLPRPESDQQRLDRIDDIIKNLEKEETWHSG